MESAKPYVAELLAFSKKHDVKELEAFLETTFDDKFWNLASEVDSSYPKFIQMYKDITGLDFEK